MGLFGESRALGIDIGSAATKAVAVRIENRQPVLVAADTLDTGAEGILNQSELFGSVANWLQESPWAQGRQAVGLPQYVVTTQITDFPPGVRDGLADMVRFETQQLAGLSDETFIHDFHVLPPGHGRRNPVLIGLCRESVVQERLDALGSAGLHPHSLGTNGIAALNALLHLHPEVTSSGEQPQVLLDIGQDSTTIVVFLADQPLYTGTLDFGSHMLNEAMLERTGGDERKAEQRKRELDVEALGPSSPARELLRRLDSEILNALDHWRDQQGGQLAEQPILAMWLCGGGGKQNGLDVFLADRYECPVHQFGLPDPGNPDAPMTEYAAALGLALLAANAATVPICLLPAEAKWELKRRHRLPWLVAGTVLFGLALAMLIVSSYLRSRHVLARQGAELEELAACAAHIPRLQTMQDAIRGYESKVAPLVEKGNRCQRILRGIDDLGVLLDTGAWFVYLGDDLSYEAGKPNPDGARKHAAASPPPPRSAFGGFHQPQVRDVPNEFPERMQALAVPLMRALIVAGFTPFSIDDPYGYGAVTRFLTRLNELPSYSGVDSLSPLQQSGREDIFVPWSAFQSQNPDVRYSPFVIRLPFSSLPLAITEPKPAKERK